MRNYGEIQLIDCWQKWMHSKKFEMKKYKKSSEKETDMHVIEELFSLLVLQFVFN